MNDNHTIITEFLAWRKERGLHARCSVKKLIDYLDERNIDFSALKVHDAQEYQGWLLSMEKQKSGRYDEGTIAKFIKAAVSFYDFLKGTGRAASNPFAAIRRKRLRKKVLTNIPSEKKMNEILAAIGRFEDESGLRNRKVRYRLHVIAEVLYSTGMRELVLCEKCDRTLLFGAQAAEIITLLNRLLRKVSKEIGISVMTSHKFRHAFGTHFLKRGCSIRHIQELLGHKAIKNIEVYTKVDRDKLKQVFDECHPRKFKGAAG